MLIGSVAVACLGLGVVAGLSIHETQRRNVELTFDKHGVVTAMMYKVTDNPLAGEQTQWVTHWYTSGEILGQMEIRGKQPTGRNRTWDITGFLRSETSIDSEGRLTTRTFYSEGNLCARGTHTADPNRVRWQYFD